MKVEIEQPLKLVEIRELNPGETFSWDGKFYLVTRSVLGQAPYCVRLKDGALCPFAIGTKVERLPLKAVPDEG